MTTQTDSTLYIDQLPADTEFEVTHVRGGRRAKQRLAELGLPIGSRARIVERYPLIVSVGETRLALGRGLASKVVVRLLVDDSHSATSEAPVENG
ncbi:ferrous iron transport protein A [bacterium]|nr:ferrous iron transport protein A [bacterium]